MHAGATMMLLPATSARPASQLQVEMLLLGAVSNQQQQQQHHLGLGGSAPVDLHQANTSRDASLQTLSPFSLSSVKKSDTAGPPALYFYSVFRRKRAFCWISEIKFSLCNFYRNLLKGVELGSTVRSSWQRCSRSKTFFVSKQGPRDHSDYVTVIFMRRDTEFGGLVRHCLFYFLLYKWFYVIAGTT
ncbi:hypothetical protein RRG08_011182 [Elysia crispata]|uniref:Uncharacterized protein n=1 Tax=Elysia crispata TaxID=231223 RepID=A0AAE1D8A9_9GAST|nr:hypothetical protein RRG08_011182 [Elysia crispata]